MYKCLKYIGLWLLLSMLSINIVYAEIGNTYINFWDSKFVKLFNIKEINKYRLKDLNIRVKCKPIAFQKEIDIDLLVDKNDIIIKCSLYLSRAWIDSNVVNAQNITEAFIREMIPTQDSMAVIPLLNNIDADKKGIYADELEALEVFINENDIYTKKMRSSYISLSNNTYYDGAFFVIDIGKKKLLKQKFEPKHIVNSDVFFLNEYDLIPKGLKLIEYNDDTYIWHQSSDTNDIIRLIDYRKVCENEEDAIDILDKEIDAGIENYYQFHVLNEDPYCDKLLFYRKRSDSTIIKEYGYKMESFYVYFRYENIFAKIFISGKKTFDGSVAYEIAKMAYLKVMQQ